VARAAVQSASDAQAVVQGILSDARREAAAIVERARRQAEDVLSAAHREANDFLRGASLPEASSLLVRESAVAFSERVVEDDRLNVQECERALAKKEAELASWETDATLWEAEAARELERLESMEVQIAKAQELEQFEARVSKRLEEECPSNAHNLANDRKALHADYCKRTQQSGDRYAA
jgi:cell division septum initiation protein DivIVA